nr:reverse transcriptase domain-containing protein [Tanacetum cinerariifolium]
LVSAFTSDGLSAIATRLGTPIMLDSCTITTCMQSKGRMDFARALIDIRDNRALQDTMVISIPNLDGNGTTHDGSQTVTMKTLRGPPTSKQGRGVGHNQPKKHGFKYVFQKKSDGNSSSMASTLVSNVFYAIGDMDDIDRVVVSSVIEVETNEDKGKSKDDLVEDIRRWNLLKGRVVLVQVESNMVRGCLSL